MADKIQFGAEFILEMPPDGPLEMRRQMRELKKIIKETIPEQELFASASQKITSMTELLNHQLSQGIITQDHYTAAVKRLNEMSPQAIKAQQDMTNAIRGQGDALSATAKQWTEFGKSDLDKWKDRVKSLTDVRMQMSRPDFRKSWTSLMAQDPRELQRQAEAQRVLKDQAQAAAKAEQELAEKTAKETRELDKQKQAVQALAAQWRELGKTDLDKYKDRVRSLISVRREMTRDEFSKAAAALRMQDPRIVMAELVKKQTSLPFATPASQQVMTDDMRQAMAQLPVIGRFTSALGPMTAGVVAAGLAIGVMGAQFRMMGSAASYASQNIQTAFQEIDATSDAAEKLGISATSLNILQTQAAMSEVGVESLTNGIQKLELSLADAVEQGGSAAEKFSKLGLSAEQLIRMKPDAAFGAIADAIGKLPSRAQQLNAVFDIFGKANTDIVRMLDSFRSMEKAAIDSGIVISKEQRDAINTADDQFRQLGLTVKGIWAQVAVELVPAFGRLAEAASDFLSDKKTRDEIVATFSRIGTVVDMVAQNFGNIATKVKSLFDFVGNHPLASMVIGTPMIAPLAGAAAVLKPSAEDVNDATFKRLQAETSIALERMTEEEKVLAQMSNLAVANLTQPTLGFGVFSIWDGLGEKIQKTVEEQQKFTDNLRWQLEITGKTADEIEMMKAGKLGMSAQQLDEIQRLLQQKNIMQDIVDLEKERATEQKNAMTEGERLRDSLMTAEEKLQQQAFHWRDLLDRGAISQREFEQLIMREGSQIMGNPAVPETIKAGSVEALRAEFGQTKDRQSQMVGILQQIADNTDPDVQAAVEVQLASID